jgi:MFS family permease
MITTDRPAGYLELLRTNRDFRNLWFGQVVSELGDWFSTIALLNLMLELTGRAQSLAWFFIVIYIPGVIVGPAAGVLVDRLDRKRLMIAMDLVRAFLVLLYLLIRQAGQIWLIYVIAAVEVSMMMLFEPARTAAIPNLCKPRELVAANALGSITWSTVLTIGAAVGGLVTAFFGRNVCYLLDSLSFFASAFFISRIPNRFATARGRGEPLIRELTSVFVEIGNGLKYIRSRPAVMTAMLVKTAWGLGGGVILLLSIFGQTIFPLMGSGAAGIGALYAARGIGAGLGPIIARRLAGEKAAALRGSIAVGFFLCCFFYIGFGQAPNFPLAAFALIIAHMGGSVLWVFSTVLLQLEVADELRGRVFALDLVLSSLGFAVSNYVAGYLLDVAHLSPRSIAGIMGAWFLLPGILWIISQRLIQKRKAKSHGK